MTSSSAARRLLGLDPGADADAVHAARRRLAKTIHPDVAGGDVAAMQRLNEAADAVLHDLTRPAEPARPGDAAPDPGPRPRPGGPAAGMRVDHDVASFVIELLPVEAFEALVVVTSWLGDVLVDDPPYLLEVMLAEPVRCWCRLDLVPDAGASTVSVTIVAIGNDPLPDIDSVRDAWVAALNELG